MGPCKGYSLIGGSDVDMEKEIVYRQYWSYGRRYCLVDGSNGAMENDII